MKRWLILLAAVRVLASARAAFADPAACIADWSVAARVVAKENLATVEDVTRRIGAQNPGAVVKAVLCGAGGSYVYKLTLKDASGALKNVIVDARGG